LHLLRAALGPTLQNKQKRDARELGHYLPVVGIGSSAEGVEALQLLFQNVPADIGMAFIVVSHLARDYQSLLPEIVARHARMRVTAAADGEQIEPNTVLCRLSQLYSHGCTAPIAADAAAIRSPAQTHRCFPELAR
jgi:chemotaxis response regulator CheB